jgi:hypothetical protein
VSLSVVLGPALAREENFLVTRNPDGLLVARWRYDAGFAPSGLIVGTSGSGKTALLRWMIMDTICNGVEKALWLADGKGADSFLMFSDQPGVADVVNRGDTVIDNNGKSVEAIVDMVRIVHTLVEDRYSKFAKAKRKAMVTGQSLDYELPPLVIFCLDDYMDWEQGLSDRLRKEMLSLLVSMGQKSREVNVHLWLATQAPYANPTGDTGMPGLLKRQLKARIAVCGTMDLDDIESKMAFNDVKAGERLEQYARRANLWGEERLGLGLFAIGRREVAFKAPWICDPYHWESTEAERQEVLQLLPAKKLHLVEGVS